MDCVVCSKLITHTKQRHAKFCSPLCRRTYTNDRWKAKNPKIEGISSGSVGAAHELLVAYHLLRHGLYVYRSLSPNSPCDLAVLLNKQLIMIEVTTGNVMPSGKISYANKSNTHQFDVLAIVLHSGEIIYRPDDILPIK